MHVLSFEQLGHGPANDEAAGNHGLSNAAERAGPSSGASKAWRFWLRAALCTTFATVLVLTVDSRQHAIDAGAEAAYRADLRRLQTLDAELDRELLRARSGLTLQYDGLTQTFQELREVQGRLAQPPARLAFSSSPTLSSALHRLEQLTRQQQSWLDCFKSENSLLRSSRRDYPERLDRFHARLLATPDSAASRQQLVAILGALSHLDVAATPEAVARLSTALDALESAAASPAPGPVAAGNDPELGADLALVLQHGRLIAQHAPLVDEIVAQVLGMPLASAIQNAIESYDESYGSALGRAQKQRGLLAGLAALGLLLGLLEVSWALRSKARALRLAEDELEQVQLELDRERQRKRQQTELGRRFVSATPQRLRPPLSTILSSSRLLSIYSERWSAQRRLEHVEHITAAALHMRDMLEDLLLIGRAEVGALQIVPAPLDLRTFCQQLIEVVARSVASVREEPPGESARRVHLSCRGAREVRLDRRLLTHVIGNLLENALKYSPPHSEVGLHVHAEPAGLRCVVQDSGRGIAEEELPHLFESFWRGKNVGKIAGTGLGLSVVKRALDVQRGQIEVRSEPGKGTEFVVWLPLAERPAPHVARAMTHRPSRPAPVLQPCSS